MKKHLLMKTLLVALVCLVGGTSSVWATDVPAPVYFLNFDGNTVSDFGGIQHGSGRLMTSSDTRFGRYYQNMPEATEATNWTNFLEVVPTTNPWSVIKNAGTYALTISFWVNATVANANNIANYWGSLFTGYTQAGLNAHQWPVGPDVRYLGQFHFNNDGAYADNDGSEEERNAIGAWDNDNNWHHFAWVFTDLNQTTFTLKLYIDGTLKYTRSLDVNGAGKTGLNMLDDLDRFTIGGNTPIWENPDNAFGYDDIALYSAALTAEQISQIITDKNAAPAISAIPASYDFSTLSPSVSPFDNCTWEKGTYVNAIRFAGANSVTGTAYFDSDASEAGNQAYTISANETVNFTINAFHGYLIGHKQAVFSIKNSAGVVLASYQYDSGNNAAPTEGRITDVKIGGTTVAGFEAFEFRSMNNSTNGANGFIGNGNKPYSATAANHPVITISICGDGNVKLKFTRTLAGAVVSQEFSGTLGGDVAKNMASIVVNDGINNSDRAYAIQKLTITSEHPYSVTAIDKDNADLFEIASGMAATGGNITVPFNKYYKTGNSLLQANAIDDSYKQFSYTFAIAASTNAKTIKYNATALNNVVFYAEGENIASASVVSAGTLNSRGSGRKGTAGTNLVITTLPAGKYKVTVNLGGKKGQAHTVKAGTSTIITVSADEEGENYLGDATLKTITSAEFTLDEPTEITYTGGYATSTASNAHGLDYIYIQNLTDQNATLNSAGLASFSSAYPLDLDNITGAKAYYAKSDGLSAGKVTLTEATGSVAAGEGLILKGENGAAVTIPVAATGTAISGNLMVGCPTAQDITASTDGYANIYVLGASDAQLHNVKDYVDTNTTLSIPAGKAYLKASLPSGARSLTISFEDDDVTGVNEVRSQKEDVRSEWFDLQGRKVAQPQKGLYIVNGKKVVLK